MAEMTMVAAGLLLTFTLTAQAPAAMRLVRIDRTGLPPYTGEAGKVYVLRGDGTARLRVGDRVTFHRPDVTLSLGILVITRADADRAEGTLAEAGESFPMRGDEVVPLARPGQTGPAAPSPPAGTAPPAAPARPASPAATAGSAAPAAPARPASPAPTAGSAAPAAPARPASPAPTAGSGSPAPGAESTPAAGPGPARPAEAKPGQPGAARMPRTSRKPALAPRNPVAPAKGDTARNRRSPSSPGRPPRPAPSAPASPAAPEPAPEIATEEVTIPAVPIPATDRAEAPSRGSSPAA